MNNHDTLANLILDCEETGASPRETADYLIERGVRLPARKIATATELDELPYGSIVTDHDGDAWQRRGDTWVCATDGGVQYWSSDALLVVYARPVTLVHTPTEVKS